MTGLHLSRYINGWRVSHDKGDDVLTIAYDMPIGSERQAFALRIKKDRIEMDSSDGTNFLVSKEAADALRAVLVDQYDRLYIHRVARVKMWERLFLKFIEDDLDVSPHHAAARATECLEYWELKRKEAGLSFLHEEPPGEP